MCALAVYAGHQEYESPGVELRTLRSARRRANVVRHTHPSQLLSRRSAPPAGVQESLLGPSRVASDRTGWPVRATWGTLQRVGREENATGQTGTRGRGSGRRLAAVLQAFLASHANVTGIAPKHSLWNREDCGAPRRRRAFQHGGDP